MITVSLLISKVYICRFDQSWMENILKTQNKSKLQKVPKGKT